jgi:hypothetical protein
MKGLAELFGGGAHPELPCRLFGAVLGGVRAARIEPSDGLRKV